MVCEHLFSKLTLPMVDTDALLKPNRFILSTFTHEQKTSDYFTGFPIFPTSHCALLMIR